jgi:hypothetical protein
MRRCPRFGSKGGPPTRTRTWISSFARSCPSVGRWEGKVVPTGGLARAHCARPCGLRLRRPGRAAALPHPQGSSVLSGASLLSSRLATPAENWCGREELHLHGVATGRLSTCCVFCFATSAKVRGWPGRIRADASRTMSPVLCTLSYGPAKPGATGGRCTLLFPIPTGRVADYASAAKVEEDRGHAPQRARGPPLRVQASPVPRTVCPPWSSRPASHRRPPACRAGARTG